MKASGERKSAGEVRRIRMTVSGRVQGVFFRHHTREQAERIGITGWVRNLPDGRVEVVAEGTPEQLRLLEASCWEGPPYARVQDVLVREEPVREGEFSSFEVVY
ncbi:MAG: acylphosphatase [bacterium]